jgi:hypothetical protein
VPSLKLEKGRKRKKIFHHRVHGGHRVKNLDIFDFWNPKFLLRELCVLFPKKDGDQVIPQRGSGEILFLLSITLLGKRVLVRPYRTGVIGM